MIRIHNDHTVPKYVSGTWSWNKDKKKIQFSSWDIKGVTSNIGIVINGLKFLKSINQIEEDVLRQEFTRPEDTFDTDIILIQDIKNLVLFLAPSEILTNQLIDMLHTNTVDLFLNALIIYFEYFLRLVEFILIRRDELVGKSARLEDIKSIKIKRIFAKHLSQYRLILARDYSPILMGTGEMRRFHHLADKGNISKASEDLQLHEGFRAISTQIVWIAHHRRGHEVIQDEMNRLFCSNHYKLNKHCPIKFKRIERELLFGERYKHVNFRYQSSPVIQEITNVLRKHVPLLWLGHKKYNGNDLRLKELELEIILPESQLLLASISHGILGHPKYLYNTLLELNYDQVRQVYSEKYDPYQMVVQPSMELPKLDLLEQNQVNVDAYFCFKDSRYEYTPKLIEKWKRRDKIIQYVTSAHLLLDVAAQCRIEIKKIGKYEGFSKEKTDQLIALKQKSLRKK